MKCEESERTGKNMGKTGLNRAWTSYSGLNGEEPDRNWCIVVTQTRLSWIELDPVGPSWTESKQVALN